MTKLYSLLILLNLNFVMNAQIVISDSQPPVTNPSILIDFNLSENNTSGIILPAINSVNELTNVSNGTFVLDKNDKKIKMRQNNTWIDLTAAGNTDAIKINPSEDIGKGVVIGSDHSNSEGALVMESEHQALVLPKIESPHINVKSPYPGMMCYDTKTDAVAFYNGKDWSYWK